MLRNAVLRCGIEAFVVVTARAMLCCGVLCCVLTSASSGAARVALGPELPAVFSNNDDTWAQLEAAAKAEVRAASINSQDNTDACTDCGTIH